MGKHDNSGWTMLGFLYKCWSSSFTSRSYLIDLSIWSREVVISLSYHWLLKWETHSGEEARALSNLWAGCHFNWVKIKNIDLWMENWLLTCVSIGILVFAKFQHDTAWLWSFVCLIHFLSIVCVTEIVLVGGNWSCTMWKYTCAYIICT